MKPPVWFCIFCIFCYLGLKPGGVPPFPVLLNIKGIIDKKFCGIKNVAFNAGHKSKSIIMNT